MGNHFHKNPICFGIYADFEADKEIDNSSIGKKTTKIFEQNPILNGYKIVSELDDILQSYYYHSHLVYDNVDWLAGEVKKIRK